MIHPSNLLQIRIGQLDGHWLPLAKFHPFSAPSPLSIRPICLPAFYGTHLPFFSYPSEDGTQRRPIGFVIAILWPIGRVASAGWGISQVFEDKMLESGLTGQKPQCRSNQRVHSMGEWCQRALIELITQADVRKRMAA